jgi:hypothetical protein
VERRVLLQRTAAFDTVEQAQGRDRTCGEGDGDGPATINSAQIALCKAAPAVDRTIDPTTDDALAFSGTPSVTIAQGAEIWSDPIDFTVPALGNISITTAFGGVLGRQTIGGRRPGRREKGNAN